jgi:tetratricopeptide (TPR) repeat protein
LNLYIISVAAGIFDFWGRTNEAVRECRKALDVDPNYLLALYFMGGALSRAGRHGEAIEALERAAGLAGRAPFYLGWLGWALARGGRQAEARACLDALETRAATEYVGALCRAIICAGLGDTDRAFELFDECVAMRNSWIGIPRMAFLEDLRRDRDSSVSWNEWATTIATGRIERAACRLFAGCTTVAACLPRMTARSS